jgi:ABC-type uncharacterized transport system permease subunit
VPMTRPVQSGYLLNAIDPISKIFPNTPANISLLVALFCAVALWFILWRTSLGFSIRATGQNEEAAQTAGINVKKIRLIAMTMAGSFAGLVGLSEILGYRGVFHLGFSPDYGFLGIAVALLARNSPLGIIFSALLFGSLHRGSLSLDLETEKITRDFSYILQALIILFVSVRALPNYFSIKKKATK